MATDHVVQQGEHLSSIASQYGFSDYTVVWDHGSNAALKQLRGNPNVLLPGDSVFIPDPDQKQEAGETAKRHTFTLGGKTLTLRLVLEDAYRNPLANTPCDLLVGGRKITLTSDASGGLEQTIAADTGDAGLDLSAAETPFRDDLLSLRVGHLDPVETLAGQAARLDNLGYAAGSPATADDPGFQSAVQEFQCDVKLTVDGDAGPLTQAKLREVHGC